MEDLSRPRPCCSHAGSLNSLQRASERTRRKCTLLNLAAIAICCTRTGAAEKTHAKCRSERSAADAPAKTGFTNISLAAPSLFTEGFKATSISFYTAHVLYFASALFCYKNTCANARRVRMRRPMRGLGFVDLNARSHENIWRRTGLRARLRVLVRACHQFLESRSLSPLGDSPLPLVVVGRIGMLPRTSLSSARVVPKPKVRSVQEKHERARARILSYLCVRDKARRQ